MKTHSVIFQQWRDVYILPDGRVSIRANLTPDEQAEAVPVVEDWAEPSCWACGRPVIGDTEKKSWRGESVNYSDIWDDRKVKSKLQRCHILARQFGGSDDEENLFLMCSTCHAESPDVRNKKAFFRWVRKTRRETVMGFPLEKIVAGILEEVQVRGMRPDAFLDMFVQAGAPESDFQERVKRFVGLHASTVAESSMVIGAVDTMEDVIKSRIATRLDELIGA